MSRRQVRRKGAVQRGEVWTIRVSFSSRAWSGRQPREGRGLPWARGTTIPLWSRQERRLSRVRVQGRLSQHLAAPQMPGLQLPIPARVGKMESTPGFSDMSTWPGKLCSQQSQTSQGHSPPWARCPGVAMCVTVPVGCTRQPGPVSAGSVSSPTPEITCQLAA